MAQEKNGPSKTKMAPSLFTNDIFLL